MTAYELLISDCSSDVCSSDLPSARPGPRRRADGAGRGSAGGAGGEHHGGLRDAHGPRRASALDRAAAPDRGAGRLCRAAVPEPRARLRAARRLARPRRRAADALPRAPAPAAHRQRPAAGAELPAPRVGLLRAAAGGRRPGHHADRTRHGAAHPGASALGSSGPVRGWHRRNAQDQPAARPWRRLRRLAGAAVVLLLLYGLGFLWFRTLLPSPGSGDERSTDPIEVLTGGSAQLAVPLDLLSAEDRNS